MKPEVHFNKYGLHKVNGPARVWPNGSWVWALNGNPHRYYGPNHSTGSWKLNGVFIKWEPVDLWD